MPRLTDGLEQIFTSLGIVGSGYKLFFFETGTTTLKSTYSDEDLTVVNSNPIVLNAAGRPDTDVWGSDASLYRMILGTTDSVVGDINAIVDIDPVDNYDINSIVSLDPIPTAYWGLTTGISTAYTLENPLVDISSYSNKQTFFIDFNLTCGDNPTLKIKDLDAITLKKYTGAGTKVSLIAGDIKPQRYLCINDGSNIVVLNPTYSTMQSGPATALTISDGTITINGNSSSHSIDTESSASSDDLDTINGGQDGQVIFIRLTDDARNIILKHNIGNIFNPIGTDITLDLTSDIIQLRYSSTLAKWVVTSQQTKTDFLSSKAQSGYQYLPNGLIFQWGRSTVNIGATTSFSLPITFPNAAHSGNSSLFQPVTGRTAPIHIYSLSTSQITLHNANASSSSDTASWWVIGN
jgi:hypothetical protein